MIGLAHDQMPDLGVDYDQKYLYNNEAIRRSAAIIVTQEELVSRVEAETKERYKETVGRPTKEKSSQTFDSIIVDESTDVVVDDGIDWDASLDDPESKIGCTLWHFVKLFTKM